MAKYEVGTTALFWGEYRERDADGNWRDAYGRFGGNDTTAEAKGDGYTNITPPGPPLLVGDRLQPNTRYVVADDLASDRWSVLEWSKNRQLHTIASVPRISIVGPGDTIREIRRPRTINQTLRDRAQGYRNQAERLGEYLPDRLRERKFGYLRTARQLERAATELEDAVETALRSELKTLQSELWTLRTEIAQREEIETDLRMTVKLNSAEISRKNRLLAEQGDKIHAARQALK